MNDHTPPTTQQLDDTYRDDVREILEAEGWHETAEDTVVADNGALWTETNDCRDSGVDAPDKSWSVSFDSGVPASVIAAVAVVAGGTDLVAEVRRLRAALDRTRALAFLHAADFLRDGYFQKGLSVQEIGTALRHTADEADPMVGSLARDGFGLDEIADVLSRPVVSAVVETGEAGA